jgi:hypothetical protein
MLHTNTNNGLHEYVGQQVPLHYVRLGMTAASPLGLD